MNTNLIHNIINFLVIGLPALLLGTGCVQLAGGNLDCSASWLDPQIVLYATGALGVLKVLLNVFRDGITGLWKAQLAVRADATIASAGTMQAGPNK